MKNLLELHSPDIVLETHGIGINGIGGSLKKIFDLLDSYGYGYFDMKILQVTYGSVYAKTYANSNATVMISKKLNDEKFVQNLKEKIKPKIEQVNIRMSENKKSLETKNLINEKKFQEALEKLENVSLDDDDAEAQYHLAFTLHTMGIKYEEALQRYTIAFEKGFDPFWVYYNRGSLYYILGDLKKAEMDLKKAESLNPKHEGVRTILSYFNK